MNKYLLIIKMDGRIYMTHHDSQYSMSREANLVQKEWGIKLDMMEVSTLEWQCCLNDYPDNSAFAVNMGTDAAIIPITISDFKAFSDYDTTNHSNPMADNGDFWIESEPEGYVSPFDGQQK